MSEKDIEFESLEAKLLAETAKISWHELQRFFAQGAVLHVEDGQNLVEVATMFAEDQTDLLQPLLEDGKVKQPSNDQARLWYKDNTPLWSVVVAPYVLVQEKQ